MTTTRPRHARIRRRLALLAPVLLLAIFMAACLQNKNGAQLSVTKECSSKYPSGMSIEVHATNVSTGKTVDVRGYWGDSATDPLAFSAENLATGGGGYIWDNLVSNSPDLMVLFIEDGTYNVVARFDQALPAC